MLLSRSDSDLIWQSIEHAVIRYPKLPLTFFFAILLKRNRVILETNCLAKLNRSIIIGTKSLISVQLKIKMAMLNVNNQINKVFFGNGILLYSDETFLY